MENKLKGTVTLDVNGEALTFQFTWDAIIKIHQEWGSSNINIEDPSILLKLAVLGLAQHHPEMTVERLKEIGPAVIPLMDATKRAHDYAYFGFDEPVEGKSSGDPREPGKIKRLLSFFRQLSGQE